MARADGRLRRGGTSNGANHDFRGTRDPHCPLGYGGRRRCRRPMSLYRVRQERHRSRTRQTHDNPRGRDNVEHVSNYMTVTASAT